MTDEKLEQKLAVIEVLREVKKLAENVAALLGNDTLLRHISIHGLGRITSAREYMQAASTALIDAVMLIENE